MPLTITMTAQVYKLWEPADSDAVFEAVALAGWISRMQCMVLDGVLVWSVVFQRNSSREQIQAARDDVAIFDGTTLITQTLEDYNAANPGNQIEEGGS